VHERVWPLPGNLVEPLQHFPKAARESHDA
jgi:hypothetical protein